MKFVMRPYHMVSLGGYIVEWDFPYRNLIVVNKTSEPGYRNTRTWVLR